MRYAASPGPPPGRPHRLSPGKWAPLLVILLLASLPFLLSGCQLFWDQLTVLKRTVLEGNEEGDKGRTVSVRKRLPPRPSDLPSGRIAPSDALPDDPSVSVHVSQVASKDTATEILAANRVNGDEIRRVLDVSRDVYSLSRIGVGRRYELAVGKGGLRRFVLQVDDDNQLRVYRTRLNQLRARMERIPYEIKVFRLEGVVQDSLFRAVAEGGGFPAMAMELAEIFAWVINFHKDLKKGDRLQVLIERRFLEGKPSSFGRILAAEFVIGRKKKTAIFFDLGKGGYYTPEGKSLRRAFLRSPLRFTRISSRFSHKRFHPILKRYRPHYGVDYAAPSGTPVRTVSDGVITSAGWKGAAGKTIQIRHKGGYKTSYLHLSRIRRGVKKGRRVRQGEIIGFVGSSGLSTGPHLDFRMKRHNKPIDPLKAALPSGFPVPSKDAADYRRLVELRNEQWKTAPYLVDRNKMVASKSQDSKF